MAFPFYTVSCDLSVCAFCVLQQQRSKLSRVVQDVCRCGRIPVYRDCISLLTKARDGEQPAYCLEGLFKSQVTDRKVQLLRQAYQLGRNPLRVLSGLQDPYAVSLVLACCHAFDLLAWLH